MQENKISDKVKEYIVNGWCTIIPVLFIAYILKNLFHIKRDFFDLIAISTIILFCCFVGGIGLLFVLCDICNIPGKISYATMLHRNKHVLTEKEIRNLNLSLEEFLFALNLRESYKEYFMFTWTLCAYVLKPYSSYTNCYDQFKEQNIIIRRHMKEIYGSDINDSDSEMLVEKIRNSEKFKKCNNGITEKFIRFFVSSCEN